MCFLEIPIRMKVEENGLVDVTAKQLEEIVGGAARDRLPPS